MRHQRSITLAALIAVLATLAAPGPATADDRNFMSQAAAPPNLIFILDTSSSMVGSPEVTSTTLPVEECDPDELVIDSDEDGILDTADPLRCQTLLVPFTNVPGAGDDPYSRMGIAKRVLRDFLNDIGVANVVLAGYAQAETTDPSPNDLSVPAKHWVYEARAQDRFHMLEATYAYRFGYSLDHTNSILLDNPGDIYPEAMIGYKLYFDPESTDPTERFGPTNAYDTGYVETLPDTTEVRLPYDLMPIYFGNCFIDDQGTPADDTDDTFRCWDSAEEDDSVEGTMTFPFTSSGARDLGGTLLSERYYYGDPGSLTFPNCEPSITPTADNPDDGCLAEWEEISGVDIIQHKRRVQLMIPPEISGQPNHFLADDGTGTMVGNYLDTSDTPENDNYDGDEYADADYDGDEENDWILYVASVEERNYKTCAPPEGLATWTPTPTKTYEEYCGDLTVYNLDPTEYTYAMSAVVRNYTGYTARIVHTYWDWDYAGEHSTTDSVAYMCFGGLSGSAYPLTVCSNSTSYEYWDDESGSSAGGDGKYQRPLDVTYPFLGGADTTPHIAHGSTYEWWGRLTTSASWDGVYQVCFDFDLLAAAPDGSDYRCSNLCVTTTAGSHATPTPTYPTPTPSLTYTPGGPTSTPTTPWVPGTSTPTRTPTFGFAPTSTPTPTRTSTPRPPTPTRTPSKTATPVG